MTDQIKKSNNMKNNNKKSYIPPKVEVTRVILETVIAASPVQKVNLQDWDNDPDVSSSNADVILYF